MTPVVRAAVALGLAVIHHGMANLSARAGTPASKEAVTGTADHFLTWLKTKEHLP